MEENKIGKGKDVLKEILADSTIKAGDNLKYRIMHQIEVESSVLRKPQRDLVPFVKNMFSLFGIMYLLIAIIGALVYFGEGKEALLSVAFFVPVILIASVCGVFWMISSYDDRRMSKKGC